MVAPDHASLESVELGQDEVVCLIPGGHPFAPMEAVRVEHLRSAPWIRYPATTPLGRTLFSLLGPEIASLAQIEVHSPVTAIAFAQQGLGAALVGRWSLPLALRAGMIVRPFVPFTPVKIWAVYSTIDPLPVLARRFLAVVCNVLKAEQQPSAAGCASRPAGVASVDQPAPEP